ncbi:hypothetical protein NGA_0461800 [Nannochloropsis gaditana CCMP526]|uniref:uncharacterized protein n=1 Tax=Nannochloropsis gaditana (strain CCMP526) TaxID=1093141 RepID=UPI00029F5F54|nr:hypothetical protein NGA_0461800 [Nannochloropsis gaditana CCMP526]EKU22396.1 hypothetical protein NGA_0461800 [Nannochloropsis gaditana CCMP526]|eukprot:XP_005853962.1 hypothetical protein NGA_0461800 [Nannochloropsis gaditana CCMP526]
MEGGNEDKVFHPLAERGGKLYTFSVGHSHYVLKRYHKHAAGKALKELAVLLHLSASIRACPSSAPSVHPPFLASLCGVVWNHNNTEAGGEGESGSKEEKASRPSALVLERGQKTENRVDLRAFLVHPYVLTEAAHDGVDRTGGFGDTEGASERLKQWEDFDPSERKKQWPLPARLTAKASLFLLYA